MLFFDRAFFDLEIVGVFAVTAWIERNGVIAAQIEFRTAADGFEEQAQVPGAADKGRQRAIQLPFDVHAPILVEINDRCRTRAAFFIKLSVEAACQALGATGLAARLMIDLSHANSRKQYAAQLAVATEVADQLAAGEERIFGVMVESHLKPGRQDIVPGKTLEYGVSVTDACLGWEDSLCLLDTLAAAVRRRRLALVER